MKKHNYKKLVIWQKARVFIKDIYLISAKFPEDERFGAIPQIRRAVISISNNIVEGSGRATSKDFAHFLNMSYTSALEVENLLIVSVDLEWILEQELEKYFKQVKELSKMIYSFRKSLL